MLCEGLTSNEIKNLIIASGFNNYYDSKSHSLQSNLYVFEIYSSEIEGDMKLGLDNKDI